MDEDFSVMRSDSTKRRIDLDKGEDAASGRSAVVAIIEVSLAALLTVVLWQAFKRLTSFGHLEVGAGLNFSPGLVTVTITLLLFLCRQKKFDDYGVSLRDWRLHFKTALVWAVALIPVFLLARVVFVHFHGDLRAPYGGARSPFLADAVLAAIFVVLFPWIIETSRRLATMIPTSLGLATLAGLWIAPLLMAWMQNRPAGHVFLVTLGLVVTTGFGEEFFYWGYIQPRLNEVLGRPYNRRGIRFGWGLCITSVLFGCVHALNGVDFLHGHLDLNLGWGLAAFFAGAVHGLLREATGSIMVGTLLHGINDTWLLLVIPMILG